MTGQRPGDGSDSLQLAGANIAMGARSAPLGWLAGGFGREGACVWRAVESEGLAFAA